MATAIAHLRLAQNVLDYGFQLSPPAFAAGCLAPNSCYLPESGTYPRSRTHWYDLNQQIQPEDFFAAQVANRALHVDEYAFRIGYYVHLVADVEWYAQVIQPLARLRDPEQTAAAAEQLYQQVRADQDHADFLYLEYTPGNLFQQLMSASASSDGAFDFLPEGSTPRLLAELRAYYTLPERITAARQHQNVFLQASDVDAYVECTTRVLLALLVAKDVPCPIPHPLSAYGIRTVS